MMMPVTALEETPALLAATCCALLLGLLVMLVQGATPNARRTACGMAIVTIGLAWMVLFASETTIGQNALLSDIGLNMILVAMASLITMMGAVDRARSAGLVLFALGVTATILHYAYPLLTLMLPTMSLASVIYGMLITAGMAHLVMIASLPLSSVRFTSQGERRLQAVPPFTFEAVAGGLLAVAFCALLWRMKAYEGVNTSFHIYAAMIACITSSICAAMVTLKRRAPAALNIALLAMPAGVLSVGLLTQATPFEVMLVAALTGAAVSLSRDAMLALRLDEPSNSIAVLLIPALIGLMAPGMLTLSQLATQVQWLGALAATGLVVGYLWRVLSQFTLGLTLSRRASAEGLDTTYAAASARR